MPGCYCLVNKEKNKCIVPQEKQGRERDVWGGGLVTNNVDKVNSTCTCTQADEVGFLSNSHVFFARFDTQIFLKF